MTWGDKGREGGRKIEFFGRRHLWMTPCTFNKNKAINRKYTSNENEFYIFHTKVLKNSMIKDTQVIKLT